MESWGFLDGNIANFIERRRVSSVPEIDYRLQMHSSLVRRLSLERELEGHQGCVNAVAWNSKGSLLISGSDDTRINMWSYATRKLIHCIDTGHSANIFCTKFIPETSNEAVVSGAGDAEVRLFNISRTSDARSGENTPQPLSIFQCHSRRVKKLAVELGNPNVVWSASEDGTLRQHDFREGSCCPPTGSSNQECRNVLLDLRGASKKSLADFPKHCLALKSCDISTTRPHQLLVGGSDAFARLYDRRMLPPLSSCQSNPKPPPCINHFCPKHLSDRRKSGLHLTHVTFSPNGEELLLSYSGEHVYLMDVNQDDQGSVQYASSDAAQQICLAPTLNGADVPLVSQATSKNVSRKSSSRKVDMQNKLVEAATKALENGSYLHGIEACSEILDGKGPEPDDALKVECLCIRAALFVKRKWKNDAHMAIRDCVKAQSMERSSFKAHYYMSEALSQLSRYKEALSYATAAQCIDPSNPDAADKVNKIKDHISAVEKRSKENGGTSKAEVQRGVIRSLGDVLFVPEENRDTSQDGPRSEREDSDYDDEMELDFETSISGDEEHEESRVIRGSLNLRLHPREETIDENGNLNGFCGSATSLCQNDGNAQKPAIATDMKQRYVGHCNVGTDIKQASFLGQQGEFIASGSDDGRWFIWEKRTGRLIKVLAGDEAVVNCVQCHPFDCVVATSGIDNTIKLWTPQSGTPSIVAGGTAGPESADVLSIIEANQQQLGRSRETVLPFEFFERFRMHEFAEGSLHPFECAQS